MTSLKALGSMRNATSQVINTNGSWVNTPPLPRPTMIILSSTKTIGRVSAACLVFNIFWCHETRDKGPPEVSHSERISPPFDCLLSSGDQTKAADGKSQFGKHRRNLRIRWKVQGEAPQDPAKFTTRLHNGVTTWNVFL